MIRGSLITVDDHDRDRGAQGLRHRVRHDRRAVRHRCRGQPDVPPDVPVPATAASASALAVILFMAVLPLMVINIRNIRRQGSAHDRRRAEPRRGPSPAPSCGASFVRRAVRSASRSSPSASSGRCRRSGLLVSSFRDAQDIDADRLVGRAAAPLRDLTQWTLANYETRPGRTRTWPTRSSTASS